jgi:hypothetical protein
VSAVLTSLFPAPCYVSTGDRQVLRPAAPGASARSTTRTRCYGVSATRVLAEPFVSLWLEGGLLLHLGGLVSGCCTSGARTESVSAGADGCTDSRSVESDLGEAKRVTAHHCSAVQQRETVAL